ncbi:MAG: Ig domain-containing protein [Clostridium sp.]
MKQRSKILLALLLSASVATTPIASVSVFAEDLDFVAVEDNTDTSAEDDFDSEETSVIAEDNTEADDFASEEANLFSAGEGDTTADATDQADATEAKTHSIKVTVINSSGNVSGMYAMDSVVVTRQEDGTYLVRMHQTNVNRNYMALTNDSTKATNHEVDWYVAGGEDGYWYTIPVANLTDPVYACFSYTKNVNAGKKWGNAQTITFDVSSMTETTEADAVASDMNVEKASVSATEVALDTTAKALEPGGTVKLTATITPSNTTDSTVWSSDNEDVATVTEDGTVTAVKTGSAVITATAGNVKAECTVTVSNTHAINVTVNNKTTGIYAFKNVVITKQEDGTYLVRMQGVDSVRDYIAFADGTAKTDLVPVYNHEVEWHRGKVTTTTDDTGKEVKEVTYTVPVKSLTDPIYVAFSSEQNLNDPWKKPEKRWNGAYLLKFDVDSMTDTTEGEAVASDINAVPATVTKTVLTANNTTAMFNVTDALLTKDTENGNTLTVTLHGTGYHYLYKGTYEEAVANGDNRDNWIAGELVDGKWQFKIPVANDETFLPIVAISNSYLTKYENGQNSLERAFYPRQAVIDEAAATLTTGDYDHTKDLTVNNSVKMFKVDAATLETIGGPNSNGYKEVLHLTMGSDSFDKVFIGSAEDAAKAETTTDITERKADLTVKANAMGGTTTTDYLDKEVTFSFHSVKNDSWYERVFNISKANGTLTITPVQVPATAITLNATSQKLTEGKTVTLAATVTPADTTDAVVWTSSNTKVATVSADGVVTAVKEGTAVITATAGNVKATCKITVSKAVVKVTKVSVTASARNIAAGKKVQLKAAVAPSKATNKAVTWKSSNTKVATVSSKGVVTFSKKAGGKKVTITATAKDGSKKYGKITLTCMKGSVKKITLSGVKTLKAGKTAKVKAKVTTMNGKANKTLTWTSSNTKIATVDKNGKVKAVKGKKGTVTITARATDGSGKKATIKIKVR